MDIVIRPHYGAIGAEARVDARTAFARDGALEPPSLVLAGALARRQRDGWFPNGEALRFYQWAFKEAWCVAAAERATQDHPTEGDGA